MFVNGHDWHNYASQHMTNHYHWFTTFEPMVIGIMKVYIAKIISYGLKVMEVFKYSCVLMMSGNLSNKRCFICSIFKQESSNHGNFLCVSPYLLVWSSTKSFGCKWDIMSQWDYYKKRFHVLFPNFFFIWMNFGTFFFVTCYNKCL